MRYVILLAIVLGCFVQAFAQTCPHEGKDRRLWKKVVCKIQWVATFPSRIPPPYVHAEFLGMRIAIPYRRQRYLMLRAHLWRYDVWSEQYIFFSSAAKRVDPWEIAP